MSARKQSPMLILSTFLVGFALTVMPLPDSVEWFRPYWVALVLIYWGVEAPDHVGMGVAFLSGLGLDLLTGTLMGQHALSLVIIAYIVGRTRLRMRFFPLWQQALMVFVLLLNDRLIYSWIHALSGRGWPDWQVVLAPGVALLLWPWIFLLMDQTRQRVRAR